MKRLCIVFLAFCSVLYAQEIQVPHKYYKVFMSLCKEYNVPPYTMARLIQYESGWDSLHINTNPNKTKDYGLCQLNDRGFKDLSRWHNGGKVFDPLKWEVNLQIGVKHFRFLYEKTGSWWSAVAAYNMGYQGWVDWCNGKRKLPNSTKKELDFVFQ